MTLFVLTQGKSAISVDRWTFLISSHAGIVEIVSDMTEKSIPLRGPWIIGQLQTQRGESQMNIEQATSSVAPSAANDAAVK